MANPSNIGEFFSGREFFFLGLNRLLTNKNDCFLQINETGLEWRLAEYLDSKSSSVKISIPWEEIEWIKMEGSDKGITIYEENSFSNHIPLNFFSIQENDTIINTLKEISLSRKIRLVNF